MIASPRKGYVSQFDSATLAIVDPSVGPDCKGFVLRGIDLSPWADADGIPEMDQMVLIGKRLFVVLQHLDRAAFFTPVGPGLLVVIDTTTDTVTQTLTLSLTNPFAQTKGLIYDPVTQRIFVGGPGSFFSDLNDGGIEAIDPVSLRSDGLLITGAELGGDLTDFVMTGATRGYAVVTGADSRWRLVAFDLATRTVTAMPAISDQTFADIETSELGELWLADRSFAGGSLGGVRIFSLIDGSERAVAAIATGLLPFNLVFF